MPLWHKLKAKTKLGSSIGLAMAGGGCKAFYGLGAGQVLIEAGLPIDCISATSAGSAMALALASNNAPMVVDHFCALVSKNPKNFYWMKLLALESPFPHDAMYRHAISSNLTLDKITNSKIKVYANSLRVPEELSPNVSMPRFLGMMFKIYRGYIKEKSDFEKGLVNQAMNLTTKEYGLEEIVFSTEDMATANRTENIIMASSSAPPVTRVAQLGDSRYYLDGGMVNNLPLIHLPKRKKYIAIYYEPETRAFFHQRKHEEGKDIIFLRPKNKLPITTWDYTNPYGVRATYELGKRDGLELLEKLGL